MSRFLLSHALYIIPANLCAPTMPNCCVIESAANLILSRHWRFSSFCDGTLEILRIYLLRSFLPTIILFALSLKTSTWILTLIKNKHPRIAVMGSSTMPKSGNSNTVPDHNSLVSLGVLRFGDSHVPLHSFPCSISRGLSRDAH